MVERFVVALSVVGLVDAISYMVVAPSIIFYVLQLGGTKEQYGVILSSFSFASFCTKPFLGSWCDNQGFRVPYLFSLLVAALGGLLYFLASLFMGNVAIGCMLAGRLLGGVGAASSALGYAYLAKVVPHDQQTKVNSLLSMLRIVGMAAGPGVNVFLDKIHVDIGSSFHLDELNSVGLVLIGMNVLGFLSIFFLLEEPSTDDDDDVKQNGTRQERETSPSALSLLRTCCCAEIFVPILSIFGFNANFQLIETGFAPAASDALGWGPVETSTVLGSISIVIFAVMLIVYQLSSRKVPDASLLTFGLCMATVGYTLVFVWWQRDAPTWHFVIPILLGASSFPFLGAPTRSLFTQAVDTKPALAPYSGTMQAVLSMAASIAGFVTPGLVARFVLRTPEQVDDSQHGRELSPLALFAPFLSLSTLVGLAYVEWKHRTRGVETDVELGDETPEANEQSALISSGGIDRRQARKSCPIPARHYSCHTEAYRKQSACLMGIAQTSMLYEQIDYDDDEAS